jgi:hypothetical protein
MLSAIENGTTKRCRRQKLEGSNTTQMGESYPTTCLAAVKQLRTEAGWWEQSSYSCRQVPFSSCAVAVCCRCLGRPGKPADSAAQDG